jgi:ABC-type transport system involved in Fe-S cluster assembly fused permease/ATPase subunit
MLMRRVLLQINWEYISAALNGGQALILATGVSAIMAMAGTGVIQGRMTVGDLVLANGLILQLSVPLQVLRCSRCVLHQQKPPQERAK